MVKQRKIVGIWPAPDADEAAAVRDEPLELNLHDMVDDRPDDTDVGIAAPTASTHSIDPRSWLGDTADSSSVFDSHAAPPRRWSFAAIALSLLAAAWVVGVSWTATGSWQVLPAAAGLAQWIAILSMPLALLLMIWMAIERGSDATTVRHLRLLATLRQEQQLLDERLAAIDGHWQTAQSALRERAEMASSAITDSAQSIDAVADRLDARMRAAAATTAQVVAQGAAATRQIDGLMVALPKAEDVALRTADILQGATQSAYQQGSRLEEQLAAVQSEAADVERTIAGALSTLAARMGDVQTAGQAADAAATAAAAGFASALDEQREAALAMLADLAASLETSTAAIEARLANARGALERAGNAQLAALADGVAAAQARSGELDGTIARAAERSEALGLSLGESVDGIDERMARFAADTERRLAAMAAAVQSAAGDIDALAAASDRNGLTANAMIERIEMARAQFLALGTQIDSVLPQSLLDLDGAVEDVRATISALPALVDSGTQGAAVMLERIRQAEKLLEEQAQQLAALDAGGRGMIAAQSGGMGELHTAVEEVIARIGELKEATLPSLAEAVTAQAGVAAQSLGAIETSIAQAAERAGSVAQRIIDEAVDAATGSAVERRLEHVQSSAEAAIAAATDAAQRLDRQLGAIAASSEAVESRATGFAASVQRYDSESLVRQMALASEALQSMSVDLTRVLDSDIADQAWEAWMKGDRSIFARRAVRLLTASEARDILRRHSEDEAFRHLVNRYIHDFEAMLRRLIDSPEAEALTVTLLSSDIGKIYVALAQAIERLRN